MKHIILLLSFIQSISMQLIMHLQNHNLFEKYEGKTASLVKLLLHIKINYFGDHPIFIIYDPNFEKHQPIEFKSFFDAFPVSFVQVEADFSSSLKPNTRLSDKFYNYIIFVESVHSVKHLMDPDSRSKIVLITADTSWTIRDFLKSHSSRLYANLLILIRAITQQTGVSTLVFMS